MARVAAPAAGAPAEARAIKACRINCVRIAEARVIGGGDAFALYMILRQLRHEARRRRAQPLAVGQAVGGIEHDGAVARARQPDIGQSPLLLQRCYAAFLERAPVGKQLLLPAG